MKALVLCGGFGTRLGALTRECPKALLPLAGKPLIEYTLAYLRNQGLQEVIVNLHYRGDQIRDAVGDGSRFDLRIEYFEEPALLGTAGTPRALADRWSCDSLLVVYGDLLFDEPLGPMIAQHEATRAAATLLVHRRSASNSRLVLGADRRVQAFSERPLEPATAEPTWVNSGVQILHRSLLAFIPDRSPCDLPQDVYVPNVHRVRIFGYPLCGYRCAIDSSERYEMAEKAVVEQRWRGLG
jgi:NDP-sugar pyrophosphorylase family protein